MAVTIVVFLVLGCLLEGLPAMVLLAPIMFPIAKKLGINDIHYSMVVVVRDERRPDDAADRHRLLHRLPHRQRHRRTT